MMYEKIFNLIIRAQKDYESQPKEEKKKNDGAQMNDS